MLNVVDPFAAEDVVEFESDEDLHEENNENDEPQTIVDFILGGDAVNDLRSYINEKLKTILSSGYTFRALTQILISKFLKIQKIICHNRYIIILVV